MKKFWTFGIYLLLITGLVICLYPIVIMMAAAVTPQGQIFQNIFPKQPTLALFKEVIFTPLFSQALVNSLIIATCTAVISIILGSFAAYSLSRFKIPGVGLVITLVLVTQMLPPELLSISYYKIIAGSILYNTKILLIILNTAIALPFCILMVKSIFDSIPHDIEEAGLIDGCSQFRVITRIVFPLSVSGIFAVWFFAFMQAWGEYLYGLTFTSDVAARPITVAISLEIGHYIINWNRLMALTLLASLPILILYTLLQKHFLKGLVAGAVKG